MATYTWDDKLKRYRDESGKVVAPSEIRGIVEGVIAQGQEEIRSLTKRYLSGQLTRTEWEKQAREIIRHYQSAATAIARGGWAQMTPSDWGAVGAEIKDQYAYFENFSREILAGQVTAAEAVNRAGMYVGAAWATQSATEARQALEAGYTEERWILSRSGGDSNTCDGCYERSQRGWQPIGTFPPIGKEPPCFGNCRCHKNYRRA